MIDPPALAFALTGLLAIAAMVLAVARLARGTSMKAAYGAATGLLALGFLSFLASATIGSTLDADGVLHEPFFLLPLGYGSLWLGAIVIAAAAVLERIGAR